MILTCVVRIHFISFMECVVRLHQKHFYEPFRWKPEWRARTVVSIRNVEHRRLQVQHKFTNLMRAPAINSQSMEKIFNFLFVRFHYLISFAYRHISQIEDNFCNTLTAHSSTADKFSRDHRTQLRVGNSIWNGTRPRAYNVHLIQIR